MHKNFPGASEAGAERKRRQWLAALSVFSLRVQSLYDGNGGGLDAESRPASVTPWTVAHQAPLPRNSPGKNTGVGCHFLRQVIF